MPSDERPQDMRERIFEAALAVCSEKGYAATRMDEIVRRAGISKGGLYHHFKSKRDLFLQLFDNLMSRSVQEMSALPPDLSASETIRYIFQYFSTWLEDETLMRGMMEFYVMSVRDSEIRSRFGASYDELLHLGSMLIRRGIAQGEIEPDIDPERAAEALMLGADGLVFMELTLGRFDRAAEALSEYCERMLRGLSRRG